MWGEGVAAGGDVAVEPVIVVGRAVVGPGRVDDGARVVCLAVGVAGEDPQRPRADQPGEVVDVEHAEHAGDCLGPVDADLVGDLVPVGAGSARRGGEGHPVVHGGVEEDGVGPEGVPQDADPPGIDLGPFAEHRERGLRVGEDVARHGLTGEQPVLQLHIAGRIVHTGRQKVLRVQADWSWADVFTAAFKRLRAPPAPAV